jgi:adenine/guanine phosphoribosyltransferase-like PRPP-binding protein
LKSLINRHVYFKYIFVILSDMNNYEKEQSIRKVIEKAEVKDWETGFLSFSKVNQQIDIRLSGYAADLIAERCQRLELDAVLGIPNSGIPLATLIAERLDLPLVLAIKVTDKKTPGTWKRVFWSRAESFTVGGESDFAVNGTCLEEKCKKFLLADDVIAGGGATEALGKEMINQGFVVYSAAMVSKDFQGGFDRVTRLLGEKPVCVVRIESLTKPEPGKPGRINLREPYYRAT